MTDHDVFVTREGAFYEVVPSGSCPDDVTCACCGATVEDYGGIVHTHDDSTEDCTC